MIVILLFINLYVNPRVCVYDKSAVDDFFFSLTTDDDL